MGAMRSTIKAGGLLAAGAVAGVMGVKALAPHWLTPQTSEAAVERVRMSIVASSRPTVRPSDRPGAALADRTADPHPRALPTTGEATRPPAVTVQHASPKPATGHAVVTDDLLKRAQLQKTLAQTRDQLALYAEEHDGHWPAFQSHPAWLPLTRASRPNGTLATGGPCGPYRDAPPVNPLSGHSSLGLVRNDVTPGQPMPGQGDLGFVFNVTNGRLWALEADGRTVGGE